MLWWSMYGAAWKERFQWRHWSNSLRRRTISIQTKKLLTCIQLIPWYSFKPCPNRLSTPTRRSNHVLIHVTLLRTQMPSHESGRQKIDRYQPIGVYPHDIYRISFPSLRGIDSPSDRPLTMRLMIRVPSAPIPLTPSTAGNGSCIYSPPYTTVLWHHIKHIDNKPPKRQR